MFSFEFSGLVITFLLFLATAMTMKGAFWFLFGCKSLATRLWMAACLMFACSFGQMAIWQAIDIFHFIRSEVNDSKLTDAPPFHPAVKVVR